MAPARSEFAVSSLFDYLPLFNQENTMLQLELLQFIYPQAKPVTISFHTWQQRESWVVLLSHGQLQGLGEANPFKPITGDAPEDILRQVGLVARMPLDPRTDDLAQLHHYLQHTLTCSSLIAAIDMAYHDLVGKIQQRPVYQLYSPQTYIRDNSITVFLQDSFDATQEEAKRIKHEFPDTPIIKIKLKGSPEDIERARVIQQVMPDNQRYVLDANQGFPNPQMAVDILEQIASILKNVILVEEPCAKGRLEDLKYVKEHLSSMMVFADESAATIEDVQRVIAAQAAHGVNIKLQKAGGIWPGIKIAQLCATGGVKIMVGAMIEGPIGMTADAHFAAACPNAVFTDLETDLDLPHFTTGASILQAGKRTPNELPGLGIRLDDALIQAAIASHQLEIKHIEIRNEFF